MNWDAIAAIAELTAAIGVVASLVYLATQIRHSRQQMVQNTKAIESQVAWAHASAVREIYYSRAENPEFNEFVATIKAWDLRRVEELREEGNLEFHRARWVVGTEFGLWHARFFTQPDPEDRAILETHIKLNGDAPVYRAHLGLVPDNFYRAEFMEFVQRALSGEAEASPGRR